MVLDNISAFLEYATQIDKFIKKNSNKTTPISVLSGFKKLKYYHIYETTVVHQTIRETTSFPPVSILMIFYAIL